MRGRYVMRDGELVLKTRAAPNPARSDLPCPAIRADGMDQTWNPATNKLYDSKSAYYADTKAAGCEIVGNDTSVIKERPEYEPPNVEQSIADAIKELS